MQLEIMYNDENFKKSTFCVWENVFNVDPSNDFDPSPCLIGCGTSVKFLERGLHLNPSPT
jgi:hypothetical protein